MALERLGGESEDVEIHRFGHWACGWWEALTVRKGSEAEKEALEIESELESYPVLNEDHWSEAQSDEAERIWRDHFCARERIQYLREGGGFEFAGVGDLLQCVRGVFPPYGNDGYCGILGE